MKLAVASFKKYQFGRTTVTIFHFENGAPTYVARPALTKASLLPKLRMATR
jgi:hypothetical protein